MHPSLLKFSSINFQSNQHGLAVPSQSLTFERRKVKNGLKLLGGEMQIQCLFERRAVEEVQEVQDGEHDHDRSRD